MESRISREALELAIKWSEYLESHAQKIYVKAANPEVDAAAVLAGKIKSELIKDQDSLRTIYRHGWAQLDSLERLHAAIAVLEDCNWVRVEAFKSGSKMVEKIRINPLLKECV